jgi:ATP-dependent protease HslVU (ClpYQ) peptidase subunit
MTCIVGIEHDGKVYIGGDSASTQGEYLTVRSEEKVFVRDSFAFGFCGSWRMGNLLRYSLTMPTYTEQLSEDAEMAFMAGEFVNSLRECLKDGGFAKVENNVEAIDGVFLVGWKGKLYICGEDFQIGHAAQGFYAIGSGAAHAEGALYALSASMPPIEKLRCALDTAEALIASVQGPFKVVSA